MSNYVYSTLSCDNLYNTYVPKSNDNQFNEVIRSILIKGGANVCNKYFVTNKGVVTQVSDEDLALLEKNPCFLEHKKNGFIVVDSKKEDPNEVSLNMSEKDKSAPKIPKDYKNYTQKKESGSKTIIMEKNEINK